jgi:hypothetical protein
MNIEVLERIKQIEYDHNLDILVINHNCDISLEDLISLRDFGKITIAVSTPLQASQLIGRLSGLKYQIVLTSRIPNKNYDIIIANEFTELVKAASTRLKIKYIHFLNFVKNFNLSNYYEFEENFFKITSSVGPNENKITGPEDEIIEPDKNNYDLFSYNDEEIMVNSEGNYDVFIQDIASTPIKYDKYRINYLYPAVPGKISIIMIVSSLTNKFAEVLRDIRSQNIPLIEYIIIDNAAGFRNNVKPNIRYGEKMPLDFCEYHGREMSTGEYIIILNEKSDEIDVMLEISQGNYETR